MKQLNGIWFHADVQAILKGMTIFVVRRMSPKQEMFRDLIGGCCGTSVGDVELQFACMCVCVGCLRGRSRAETDHLLELCSMFDLRFVQIADRFQYPNRSVEDLKQRYYR